MNRKHVVIVGAGPGGLTSAMILARRGFRVTVFESKDTVGGRNAQLKLGDFVFDAGPTFLMMDFVLREVFEEAGREVSDYLQFKRLDPLYRLKFDDVEVCPSDDPARMRQQIRESFPGNEAGLDRFLEKENRRYEKLFPCLQKHYSTLWTLFSKPLIRALPHLSLTQSLFQNLGSYFNDDRLKLSFTFQSKYIGMSPWKCPALFTLLPLIEHRYGIHHVMGGLHRISLAMAKVVEEHGGEIRTGTPVATLLLDGRKVLGVRLQNGERVLADDVIINADFGHAMSTLVPPGVLRKYAPKNLQKKEFSCSTFMLYLGVDRVYDLPHHNIIFAKDYRSNIDDIFLRKVPSEDFSFYVQNACATDPSLAPPGKSTIYVPGSAFRKFSTLGSPPRAWGRRQAPPQRLAPHRFTPTCVGKTKAVAALELGDAVHPHVRGEDSTGGVSRTCSSGSPPRAWGRLLLISP